MNWRHCDCPVPLTEQWALTCVKKSYSNLSETPQDRECWGVTRFCPRSGRPPSLAGFFNETEGTWAHFAGWLTPEEERSILGGVVAGLTGKILGLHPWGPVTCGGRMFIQNKGGAIGLDLHMHCSESSNAEPWHQVRKYLFWLSCHINSTYVDDKLVLIQVPPAGLRVETWYRDRGRTVTSHCYGRMPYILASVQRESMAIYVTYDKVWDQGYICRQRGIKVLTYDKVSDQGSFWRQWDSENLL